MGSASGRVGGTVVAGLLLAALPGLLAAGPAGAAAPESPPQTSRPMAAQIGYGQLYNLWPQTTAAGFSTYHLDQIMVWPTGVAGTARWDRPPTTTAPWFGQFVLPNQDWLRVQNGRTGRLEVHVVSRASDYTAYSLHTITPIANRPVLTTDQWAVGPYNGSGRPDLYFIAGDADTGSKRVEVHVLSAASNYTQWVAHAATAIPAPVTSTDVTFLVGDEGGRGDLTMIQRSGTGTGRVEVHRMTRASGYQGFDVHAATPWPATAPSSWTFALGRFDGADQAPDLWGIQAPGPNAGRPQVNVLDGRTRAPLASVTLPWVYASREGFPMQQSEQFFVAP